ncbi:HepT-like ribonuclease domain-containing protein [Brevibacterium album]|uniref:HepT-like ribonuclease domain-containing protein n=1 Tax=Brevibacterium album TaxID=417948 RepID=UPI00040C6821|nr:HepT-like ribonuclease domain-containing protein [Brevibacterium album]
MPQRELLLLAEMIDAAEQAQQLVRGRTVSGIEQDRQARDALLWNFTVLGEAASQLSIEFKEAHPEVNWARPSQLRNRIVHGYWSIDMGILHSTALDHLPDFVTAVKQVLGRLECPR